MVKKKNLASSVLSVGINDSVGSISVENGTGSYFSGLESGSYLTITPFGELPTPDNSEIVRVSSVDGDVLNVQRGMLNTTAKSFSHGAVVTNAVYVEDFDRIIEEFYINRTNDSMRLSGEKDGSELMGINIPLASSSYAGIMSSSDKSRLDSHSHNVGDINATGGTTSSYLRKDGTWNTPPNTTYSEISVAEIDGGTSSTPQAISGRRAGYIVDKAIISSTNFTENVASGLSNKGHSHGVGGENKITSANIDFATLNYGKFVKLLKSTNQSVPDSTESKILFNSVSAGYDESLFEFSSSGIKIKSSVIKSVVCSLYLQTTTAQTTICYVFKNNTLIHATGGLGNAHKMTDIILPVTANDLISFRMYPFGNTIIVGNTNWTFATVRVNEVG